MYPKFVKTSNVARFLGAVESTANRGAPEASWTLVTGDAGHGKSKTGARWAVDNKAIHIRLKAAVTPIWLLHELANEVGEKAPANNCKKAWSQVYDQLVRSPRPIVLDEVENALHANAKCLDVIRDFTDLLEVPVVLIGREWVPSQLQRHRQIWSRISAAAVFSAATLDDVTLLRSELCECSVADGVDAEILRQSRGFVREIMNALSVVERLGKRKKDAVTLQDLQGKCLVQDIHSQVMRPRRVA